MDVMKMAPADRPVNRLIAGRWSAYGFSARPVEKEKLATLFEAARWAPSSFNEQPWRYVVATKDDAGWHESLASCLVEGNAWASSAYALVLSVASLRFERTGKPNPHAWHDVGAASENMFLQAMELGLAMHEMAGFDTDKARKLLGLDETFAPVAMIAVGYPGEPDALAEPLRARQTAPRRRRPTDQFVFEGAWARPMILP